MNTSVSPIVESLKKELVGLQRKREEVHRTVRQIDTEIHQVEAAVRALLGEAPVQRRASTPEKETLKKHEILELARKAITEQGPLPEKELRVIIGERAGRAGRSRKGLHLVLPKVLKGGPFRPVDGKWTVVGRDS